MTLANFNSNFNWQLRALQRAAACCPSIPDLVSCSCYEIIGIAGSCTVEYIDCAGVPQTTTSGRDPVYVCAQNNTVNPICLPPFTSATVNQLGNCTDTAQCQPFDCYWYVQVNDPYCLGFGIQSQEWELNGLPFSFGWYSLMINPPYGTVGNGYQYTDPLNGCGAGFFNNSSYYLWTMVPSTTLSLPPLTGFDSLGNPVSYNLNGGICDTKCYEGSLVSAFGSTIIYGINTAEINASEYSFFVDLSSPTATTDFVNALGQFYPNASISVFIIENSPGDYTIRINDLYSLGTQVNLFMDDNFSVGTLNEIPC